MLTTSSHEFLDVMDMLDRRMNDRGKMWRHVYKVPRFGITADFRHCKYSITASTVDQRMWFDGEKITCTLSSLFENFNTSMMKASIKEQIVSTVAYMVLTDSSGESQGTYGPSAR